MKKSIAKFFFVLAFISLSIPAFGKPFFSVTRTPIQSQIKTSDIVASSKINGSTPKRLGITRRTFVTLGALATTTLTSCGFNSAILGNTQNPAPLQCQTGQEKCILDLFNKDLNASGVALPKGSKRVDIDDYSSTTKVASVFFQPLTSESFEYEKPKTFETILVSESQNLKSENSRRASIPASLQVNEYEDNAGSRFTEFAISIPSTEAGKNVNKSIFFNISKPAKQKVFPEKGLQIWQLTYEDGSIIRFERGEGSEEEFRVVLVSADQESFILATNISLTAPF